MEQKDSTEGWKGGMERFFAPSFSLLSNLIFVADTVKEFSAGSVAYGMPVEAHQIIMLGELLEKIPTALWEEID